MAHCSRRFRVPAQMRSRCVGRGAARFPPRKKHWHKRKQLELAQAVSKCALRRLGGTESRKNAHSIISDKQNGILLPSRFAAIGLSAIWKTIG